MEQANTNILLFSRWSTCKFSIKEGGEIFVASFKFSTFESVWTIHSLTNHFPDLREHKCYKSNSFLIKLNSWNVRVSTCLVGYKKTARSEQGGFFVRSVASVSLFPLRRISTPHKLNIINITARGMLSIWVPQLAHVPVSDDKPLKRHPTYAKSSAFLQQNYCVRSCSVIYFLLLFEPFVTTKRETDENVQNRNKNTWIVLQFKRLLKEKEWHHD